MNDKLSIICITYNQENFIEKTLQSFITQKTNFNFEIIISDDCSTDNTRNILKTYEIKYSKLFKIFYQEKNLGAAENFKFALSKVKTKYVALCEGDDYWTDEYKLQKQIDFLEANPNYSICFHQVQIVYENYPNKKVFFPHRKLQKKGFSFEHLLKTNFIQTNSVVYRWRFFNENVLDFIPNEILPGDWYLHLLHAQVGKIKMLPDVMSVYRKHAGGIWYDEDKSSKNRHLKFGLQEIDFFYAVYKNITNFSTEYFEKNLMPSWQNILALYGHAGNWQAMKAVNEKYPHEYKMVFEKNILGSKLIKYRKLYQIFILVSIIELIIIFMSIIIFFFK